MRRTAATRLGSRVYSGPNLARNRPPSTATSRNVENSHRRTRNDLTAPGRASPARRPGRPTDHAHSNCAYAQAGDVARNGQAQRGEGRACVCLPAHRLALLAAGLSSRHARQRGTGPDGQCPSAATTPSAGGGSSSRPAIGIPKNRAQFEKGSYNFPTPSPPSGVYPERGQQEARGRRCQCSTRMAGIDSGADLSDGTAPIHMQLRHD